MAILAKMCRYNLCARRTRRSVGPLLLIEPCDLEQRETEQCQIFVQPNIVVHKGAIAADRTFVHTEDRPTRR